MNKIKKTLVIIVFLQLLVLTGAFSQENNSAQKQFQIAEGAFFDGFYPAAATLFEKLIQDFPQSPFLPKAKLYIAKCHYYRRNYTESLSRLKQLQEKNYKEIKDGIDYWLARIFFQKNDFPNSLLHLKPITENLKSEYYFKAKYLQALTYLKTTETQKALSNFKDLVSEPSGLEIKDNACQNLLKIYKEQGNFPEVIAVAKEYLQSTPESKAKDQIYFYIAGSYREKNQPEKAISYYNLSLAETKNPDLRDLIYQGLGLAYLDQGKNALAKRTIDRITNNQLRVFSQGLYYFKNNDYIPALESFSSYISSYPEGQYLAKAYLTKADILYEMGRINDSASLYQRVLEKFPAKKDASIQNMAHYGLAWCYLKKGDFQRAIAEFENTLKYAQAPGLKLSAKIQIADAYQEAEEFQKALDIYNRILNDYPRNYYSDYIQFQLANIFLKQRMLDKAFLAFSNLTQNFPASRLLPEAKYYKAVIYFAQAEYIKTQIKLENLMEKHPTAKIIPEAKYLYAKSYFNQKDYEKALEILKECRTEYRNLPIGQLAYIDTGLAYLNLEEFKKAKNIYTEFLRIYPRSEYRNSVALYLGGIYEKEDNFNQAERHYQSVAKDASDPISQQKAWLSLGHLAWNRKNLEEAEKYFKKGTNTSTYIGLRNKLYLAKIYQAKNQSEAALALYQELIDSETSLTAAALANKAFLLMEKGAYPDAIKAFRKALTEGLSSAEILFSLGVCLERENQPDAALEKYFKLIYSYPDAIEHKTKTYFRIAGIYENQRNLSQARQAYQKIIDLDVEESRIAEKRLERIKN